MRTVIRNGHILDTGRMKFSDPVTLTIENGLIAGVGDPASGDVEIDARGGFVMPGFIDAHVHFRLATLNFHVLTHWSEVEYGIAMPRLASDTLKRGFTTVRDIGGDVEGLKRAIDSGMIAGPRIIRAGRILSQTGGHGDIEGGELSVPNCACQMRHSAFGIVADGIEAVRKAARYNLREGSDFIKIVVSGGVATPRDPLDSIQYTPEEVRTAVTEASHRHTYVAAHAYSPESIIMAVENGVRTIEHGNLLDDAAAQAMVKANAILVPTLATYEAMEEMGEKLGLPKTNRDKNRLVLAAGEASLEIARRNGVTMGWGTDLIGEAQPRQRREFSIRAQVETAEQILHAMYLVNPTICPTSVPIGTIEAGAAGDIVISRVNPLDNIAALAEDDCLSHVIQAGKPVDLS